MDVSSHTSPSGVITRVRFDSYDSEEFGEHGEGYFDFYKDGMLVDYDAEFKVDEGCGLNVGIVDRARRIAFPEFYDDWNVDMNDWGYSNE